MTSAGMVAATLPVYLTTRRHGSRIDAREVLDVALRQMEEGVGMLTIHPTATRDRIDRARRERRVPWTSRGGGLVIEDLVASDEADNLYVRILPELVSAAVRHGVVLSLGATFRSSNIFDTLDGVQREEIDAQLVLARELTAAGGGVVIESPGHARPRDIQAVGEKLSASGVPIMPLGPIPTDTAIGFDHVAAAIGATLLGMAGAAHILAAVTREEHTGGIPSIASTLEGVQSARVAAHIIDLHVLDTSDEDERIVAERADQRTCIAGKLTAGCSRCGKTCPL